MFSTFCWYGLTLPALSLIPSQIYRYAMIFEIFSALLLVWFDFTGFTANPLPDLHNYAALNVNYATLKVIYATLNVNYATLKVIYATLNVIYVTLNVNYGSLKVV